MPLDPVETALRLDRAVHRLSGSREDTRRRLLGLIDAAGGVNPDTDRHKTQYSPQMPRSRRTGGRPTAGGDFAQRVL